MGRADVGRAAADARRAIARLARPPGDFDARRYFRGDVDLRFYNVGTQAMRRLARTVHSERRGAWSVDDAMAFATLLIRDDYLEVKSIGIEVVARYRRDFTPRLLPAWKRGLADNHSASWATTDAICGSLIGPLLVQHPALASDMRSWARHRNMWVRRAAAVSLIPMVRPSTRVRDAGSLRAGRGLDLAYEVARTLHPDPHDLIHKAVGWMLRAVGKRDRAVLGGFLQKHRAAMPRTALRYAIERFSPSERQAYLKGTIQ